MVIGICPSCRHTKPRALKRNRQTGDLMCRPCRRKDQPPRPKEICQRCRQPGFPSVRLPNGGIVCDNCRNKDRYHDRAKWERCCRCGGQKPVAARRPAGPVCHRCYQNEREAQSRQICCRCHRPKIVFRRIDDQPWCRPCWRKAERHGEPVVLKAILKRHRVDRVSLPSPFPRTKKGPPAQPTTPESPMTELPDPSWNWCVDCGAPRLRVIVYGDHQGRCPPHGLAYLNAKRQRLASAS